MVVVGCPAHNHHISLPGRQPRHMLSSKQESCDCQEATLLNSRRKEHLTMLNDPVLVNDWHVVAYAPDLVEGKPMAVRLLDEDLVLWRVGAQIHVWRDLCLHRGTRLSLGKVEN